MNIYRNVYATAIAPKKSYKYIECKLPTYFDIGRYLTYDSSTNRVWFSTYNLINFAGVSNNTSIQDLINGTICK